MAIVASVTQPYAFFTDLEGDPLEDGSVYIGTAGLNPLVEGNRVALYADIGLTIPVAQPLKTLSGVLVRSGSPTYVYVAGVDYSIVILDKRGSLVYSALRAPQVPQIVTVNWTDIKYDRTPGEISAGVVPVNYYYQPGWLPRYGNNPAPGATDLSAAVQASLDSTNRCYIPSSVGLVNIGATVNVPIGGLVFGDTMTSSLITSPAGVVTFRWHPAGLALEGPTFRDLGITSDNPIVINDLTVFVADGAGDAYCLRPHMQRLSLNAVTANGAGTVGITMTKAFDWSITDCKIEFYERGQILQGCDIGRDRDNRIAYFSRHGILEVSAQTFGSSNEIAHNDILAAQDPAAKMIQTCARHVRLYDNYLEQHTIDVVGLIDITALGLPAIFGANVPGGMLTIISRDNRLEVAAPVTGFFHRVNEGDANTVVIEDCNTSGLERPSSFTADMVPMPNPSAGRRKNVRIHGQSWGRWDGYVDRGPYVRTDRGISVTSECLRSIQNLLQTSNLRIRDKRFVIPAAVSTGDTVWLNVSSDEPADNLLFRNGETYTASVIARSTSALTDDLLIAAISNAGGDALNTYTLDQQWRRFSWAFSGRVMVGRDNMGFYLKRGTNNGDIEILSISAEQQLNESLNILPNASPGAGTKKLWYDGADSNRVKFAV